MHIQQILKYIRSGIQTLLVISITYSILMLMAICWHFDPVIINTGFHYDPLLNYFGQYIQRLQFSDQNKILYLTVSLLELGLLLSLALAWQYCTKLLPLQQLAKALNNTDFGKADQIQLPKNVTLLYPEIVAGINSLLNKLAAIQYTLGSTQARINSVLNAMPSIMIGVTQDGVITDWNLRAADVTKISVNQAISKNLQELYPDYAQYLGLAQQAIAKNSLQKHTKYAVEIAKETKYFDIVAYPISDRNSQTAVIRIDDVTAQVLLEDIMLHTEKMNSIGGLAAGVAHEINNPLGAIMQSGQNILRRLEPDSPKNLEVAQQLGVDLVAVHRYIVGSNILEFVHGVRTAGQRAANIVNNLLQFARTSNVQKALHSMELVLENAIELAATDYNLKKKLDFRHIKIIKEYAANLPKVFCCAMEIEQVILNLLKNAAYALFNANKDPVIHLQVFVEHEVIIIKVADNGPGIKEEIKKKIFDPFFTTKPVGEGTGLGLSVSFNIIVERHGGAFTVESEFGEGATFIIALPVLGVSTGELKEYLKNPNAVQYS